MSTATHPNKPRTVFCKRSELTRWTGWKEDYIAILVAEGRLRTWRIRPGSPALYYVDSAQEIIDNNGTERNAKRPKK